MYSVKSSALKFQTFCLSDYQVLQNWKKKVYLDVTGIKGYRYLDELKLNHIEPAAKLFVHLR